MSNTAEVLRKVRDMLLTASDRWAVIHWLEAEIASLTTSEVADGERKTTRVPERTPLQRAVDRMNKEKT